MPDLRKDPVTGRWVIIATERAKRPLEYPQDTVPLDTSYDPFLEGNEDNTPPEIIAYRNPGTQANRPGWRVRVVPNKFPALQVEGAHHKRGEGMYDLMNGIGAHEVIIECPHFETSMARLPAEAVREVLWAYRDRLVDLKRDTRLVHPLIFKNKGAAAGASLAHSHSQLIVTPVVPMTVQEEIDGAEKFFEYRGRCIYCDMIQQELTTFARIVLESPQFVAFCPFASRFPFETWIVPRQHASHFETVPKANLEDLGTVLKSVLLRLEVALDDPPYNYIVHTSPFDQKELPHYHWHIEIIPRLTRVAGFEWGSGFYINSVLPERAATFLRETAVDAR